MKKFLFILAAVVTTCAAQAQSKAEDLAKFETEVYDFGKIKQGTPVFCDFFFTNVSKTPITVASATASCGCTTPTKPEQPIMPGKRDKISAGYNAANGGVFEKAIFITFEGASGPKELKIKGEVIAADAFVEPVNNPAIVKKATNATTPVSTKTVAKVKTPKTTKTTKKVVRS
jgi:Protein of unknown function (DUF1573)